MGSLDKDGISPRLTRYFALLSRFPRDYNAIEREEKSFIIDTALLLHDLKTILSGVILNKSSLIPDEEKKLTTFLNYIDGILEDFRMKDLKRKVY
jgi:hypothetical protein